MRSLGFVILLVSCRPVGSPCRSDTDCRPLAECVDWPGGYCSGPCEVQSDCGPQGACIERGDEGSLCLVRCDAGHGCRSGYSCRGTREGWEVCLPE